MSYIHEYDPNPDEPGLDPIELELALSVEQYLEDEIKIQPMPDGTYLLAYLTNDDDCESPEDGDAMGHIGTSSRNDSRKVNEVYQEALGLTSGWERKVSASDLMDELAQDLDKSITDIIRPWTGPDIATFWNKTPHQPQYWERDLIRADLKLCYRGQYDRLFEQHKKDGDFGDPDAVLLDVYEHGGRVYHVGYNHSFPDRQWDCAMGGAVWVPDAELLKEAKGLTGKKRRAKMLEWAEQLVEVMNEWMSGACYCVVTQHNDAEGNLLGDYDTCGGFIGSESAEEERDRRLAYDIEHYEPVQIQTEEVAHA